MSLVTSIIVTNSGSGYNTPNVTLAAGTLRMNNITGQMETWNGLTWITISMDVELSSIRHHIEKSVSEVTEYVKVRAPNNVTIQDALAEWLEACDKFKVITTLAEQSK
jgi:hypothetical protein